MRRRTLLVVALPVAVLAAYAGWPRHADLRAFDPAEMGRLEAAMWRDYYEKRYAALFYRLYDSSRAQFGFSPLTSARLALSAAQAAKRFQPTRSRAEAEAATRDLVTYYNLLRPAAPAVYDPQQVASRELDWWQARREAVNPEDYGATIAEVAALIYGKRKDDPALLGFGTGRALAMADRDAHGEGVTDTDWLGIEAELQGAYGQLKAAINGGSP
jgi:hypothetical protein